MFLNPRCDLIVFLSLMLPGRNYSFVGLAFLLYLAIVACTYLDLYFYWPTSCAYSLHCVSVYCKGQRPLTAVKFSLFISLRTVGLHAVVDHKNYNYFSAMLQSNWSKIG